MRDNRSNPPAAAGRREISFDGTPDAQSAPNLLPPDFFNTTVPRGAVFVSKNNQFQVSADADNMPLSSKNIDGEKYGLVVMDDFLYAEPTAIG